MTPPPTPPSGAGISRRDAIRRAAILAGIALSPEWLAVLNGTRAAAQAQRFTDAQRALVSAIAERILPRTDTPGAVDVGVPAFIDLLYADVMSDAERTMMAEGLQMVEAAAQASHGAPFGTLDASRQDAVLRGIAVAEEGRDQGFFRLMRSATILGYFTSEEVGLKVLNYNPVPGRYDGCISIDDVGRRNWAT